MSDTRKALAELADHHEHQAVHFEPFGTKNMLTNFHRKAAETCRAALATPAWQPIETAPKDGRRILVAEDGEIYMVERGMNDWFWISGGHALYVTPTHWMPLPSAPEPAK